MKLSSAQQNMLEHALELAQLGLPFRLPERYRYLETGHLVASHLLGRKGVRVTTLRALLRKGCLRVVAIFGDGEDFLLAVDCPKEKPQ